MERFNLKGNQTMKTTFRLIGAVATAAALFSSCKKEAFNEEVKPGTVEMTIIADVDDATRTVLGSDGAVTWSASGEQLAVIEVANGTEPTTAKVASMDGVTSHNGATMTFGVSMTAKTADSFDYYALYPNSAYHDTPSDFTKVKVKLASTQAPTESSFGPSADVLVAKPVTYQNEQPKELNLQFARVIAVGKMTIKNLNTTENVKKVTFTTAGKAVTGSSYIDFTTAAGVEYGYSGQGVDNVVLDYSDKTIAANGMTAYFTCWPFELAAGDTFSVVVETESYTFTKDVTLAENNSLAFKVGHASTFSVDFSRIEGVEKVVPDGAYVVTYDKNMMTVGTTSNKYRDVATLPTANADNSYLVDATAAWNFVYDSTTDTYQIYSASDNTLYLQGSSSASDFKLVAEADATSFKITKNEDGTFKIGITSNSKTRYIGYNTTAPRFAMYAGSTQQPADVNLYPAKVAILPKITVQKTLEVPSAGTNYELYTFPVAFTNVETAEVTVHGDADCTTTVDWIDVGISDDLTEVQYMVEENTGAARTAYIKIRAQGPDAAEATAIVTATQAGVSDGGETPADYTFATSANSSNTDYTTNYDVTISEKKWSVPGNQQFTGYVRIGGKSLSNTVRYIFSKTALPSGYKTITMSTNGVSNASLTVGSVVCKVYSSATGAANGGDTDLITTMTNTDTDWAVSTAKTIIFKDASNAAGHERYYRFEFTLTNTNNKKNYGVDLQKIVFSAN